VNPPRLIFALLLASLFAAATAPAGEPASALKRAEIRAKPYRDAKQVGSLARGDKVEILRRQGGWYEIKSVKGSGWVRMLNLRRGAITKRTIDAGSVLGLASGRSGTGQIVATTGIRGLTEEKLKQAKFNEAELKKVESFTVSQEAAQAFAAEGKLAAQKVEYLAN
jgi:Bacterial SH3 domain